MYIKYRFIIDKQSRCNLTYIKEENILHLKITCLHFFSYPMLLCHLN